MESIHQDFIAWSLYTGPALSPPQLPFSDTSNNIGWVCGTWNGGNGVAASQEEYKEEIKKDLEARIKLIIEVFKQSIPLYKTRDRHFVMPEFFFRCTHGPYPHLPLRLDTDTGWEFIDEDGNARKSEITQSVNTNTSQVSSQPVELLPFEYMIARLSYEFRECICKHDKDEKNIYNIVIGSMLTSNQADYQEFLNSDGVKKRTEELNNILTELYKKFLVIWNKGNQNQQTFEEDIAILNRGKGSFANSRRGFRNLISSLRNGLVQKNTIITEFNNMAAMYESRLTRFMEQNQGNPLCTVRNRGAYFYFRTCTPPGGTMPKRMMQVYRYEKQNQSAIDLLMGTQINYDEVKGICTVDVGNMITEWMCNYPAYTLYYGDKHSSPDPSDNTGDTLSNDLYDDHEYKARFTPIGVADVDFGVEICMDHWAQRLRRTVGMVGTNDNDTKRYNYPMYKQIVPSSGMQLLSESIAAHNNSVIFHADGDGAISVDNAGTVTMCDGKAGSDKGIFCGVYALSAQSVWLYNQYQSHSQLAFTTESSSIHGFNNGLGENNEMATTYNGTAENPSNRLTDSYEVQILPLNSDTNPFEDLGEVFEKGKPLFAAGVGELHYYGLKQE